MPRTARQTPGGMIFHVINRGNGRDPIFADDADYAAFEKVLAETQAEVFGFNDKPSARGSNSGLSDECELGEM